MAVSKAQRAAANKWDSANMAVVTCKVKRDLADDFKATCRAAGETPNAVLRETMIAYISEHAQK